MSTQSLYSQLFFPHFMEANERVKRNGERFAYYTTAQTAFSIIKNGEVWMRHTGVMNDYREVEHGLECVAGALASDAGVEFKKVLELCFPGSAEELERRFLSLAQMIRHHTYVTSFSEHIESEDKYGRLSMWRAYGGSAGVALILNGGVMTRPSDALGANASPVAYMDALGVAEELGRIACNINSNVLGARSFGREGFLDAIIDVFRYAAICTKHPSFKEEREWRVVTTQKLQASPRLKCDIELLGGIPQKVLKIKLEDYPDEGLHGLHPSTLIDHILIGPCDYPEIVKAALVELLEDSGVQNAESKIRITGIPLRPNQR